MSYQGNPIHAPIGRSASPNPYGYAAPVARPVSRGPSPQPYGHPTSGYAPPAGYGNPAPSGYGNPGPAPTGYGNPTSAYSNPVQGYGNPAAGGYGNPGNPYSTPTTYAAPLARPVSRGPSPAPGAYGVSSSPYQGYGGNPIGRPLSRGPSPAPPGVPQPGDIRKRPSTSNFQVEKRAKSPNPYGRPAPQQADPYQDEQLYRDRVSDLIAAKDNQFAVTGRIPIDPAKLVLFFRAKSGITHALDFPIDMSYDTPAALDVLINACRPHPRSEYDTYASREGLFFPPNQALTSSLDIGNYPILDAIKNSLYPLLPPGEYLTVEQERLDVIQAGSHIAAHSPALLRNDQRAGTIVITLPIRFQGGAVNVRDAAGRVEKFQGTGSKPGDIEWIAFRSDCDYEVEPVQKGCLITLMYGIYIKSFGPAASTIDTLLTPSDAFFDALAPILNLSRGRSVGFYLNHDYDVNPAEVPANSLVPQLKGADATLYAAFKLHKLAPELHWTAGGFIWAKEQTLELFVDGEEQPASANPIRNPRATPFGAPIGTRGAPPPARGTFGAYPGGRDDGAVDAIRARVQSSGAISLADAHITLLTDYKNPAAAVGRERVYFVSDNDLEKLVVNTLLVVYIP